MTNFEHYVSKAAQHGYTPEQVVERIRVGNELMARQWAEADARDLGQQPIAETEQMRQAATRSAKILADLQAKAAAALQAGIPGAGPVWPPPPLPKPVKAPLGSPSNPVPDGWQLDANDPTLIVRDVKQPDGTIIRQGIRM